jgi:hypothetical protein
MLRPSRTALALCTVAVAACGGRTNTAPRDDSADGTALPADGALDLRDSATGSDAHEGGSAPGDAAIADAPMDTAYVGPCDPTKPDPVMLAAGGQSPLTGLAIDESFVYFSLDPIGVARVPKNGGMVEQPLGGDGGAGQWSLSPTIATSGGYVYWTPNAVGVARVPTTDFAKTVPSVIASRPGFAGGLAVAVDDTNLYVVDVNGEMWSVPKAGGSLTPLAQTGSTNYMALAADSTGVYWTGANGVFRAAADGGAPILLVAGYASSLALDSTSVYAPMVAPADSGTQTAIVKVPKAGGPATTLASVNGSGAGIAVDDAYVYWADDAMSRGYDSDGTLRKVPKAGGPMTVVALTQWVPYAIAVDDACVFYGDVARVTRVPK